MDDGQVPAPKSNIIVAYEGYIKHALEENEIEILDKIADGGFGQVYKVALRGKILEDFPEDEVAAMKVAKITNEYYKEQSKHEIELMRNVTHKNIIRLIKVIEIPKFFIVVMELAKGSLRGEIQAARTPEKAQKNEDRLKPYIKGACEGLQFLHRSGYTHRDLKPDNILITLNNEAVLCDFSLSRTVGKGELRSTFKTTLNYASPQIVNEQPYLPQKADCWSMGVTIFKCLTAKTLLPFEENYTNDKKNEIIQKRFSLIKKSHMSSEAKNLVMKLVSQYEEDRWSMDVVLKCSFFPQESSADETQRLLEETTLSDNPEKMKKKKKNKKKKSQNADTAAGTSGHISPVAGPPRLPDQVLVENEPVARARADSGFQTADTVLGPTSGSPPSDPQVQQSSHVPTKEKEPGRKKKKQKKKKKKNQ